VDETLTTLGNAVSTMSAMDTASAPTRASAGEGNTCTGTAVPDTGTCSEGACDAGCGAGGGGVPQAVTTRAKSSATPPGRHREKLDSRGSTMRES